MFLKITGEEPLESGDIFRIGQELLRFEVISPPQPLEDGTEIMGTPNPGFWGRLSVIVGRDVDGSAFPLFGEAIVLGRERGDILFPEDGYVSGTHARISLRDEQRLPDRPRLLERDVPAPAQRAHRPHRLVHADGPAAVPPRVPVGRGAQALRGLAGTPAEPRRRLSARRLLLLLDLDLVLAPPRLFCAAEERPPRVDSPSAGST